MKKERFIKRIIIIIENIERKNWDKMIYNHFGDKIKINTLFADENRLIKDFKDFGFDT